MFYVANLPDKREAKTILLQTALPSLILEKYILLLFLNVPKQARNIDVTNTQY